MSLERGAPTPNPSPQGGGESGAVLPSPLWGGAGVGVAQPTWLEGKARRMAERLLTSNCQHIVTLAGLAAPSNAMPTPVRNPGAHTMIDHMGINAADFEASKAFYNSVFAALGGSLLMTIPKEHTGGKGVIGYGREQPQFWVTESAEKGHNHFAFSARSRAEVDAFYKAALRRQAAGTMAARACARIITSIITGPLVFDTGRQQCRSRLPYAGSVNRWKNRHIAAVVNAARCASASGRLGTASICHCRMCQKAFGNYFAPSGPRLKALSGHGASAHLFASSNLSNRGFCRRLRHAAHS